MTKAEIIEYLYENNVRGDITIEQMAEDLAEQTEPQYDFGEYADRLWKIAYERGKREALEQTEPQTDCAWNRG